MSTAETRALDQIAKMDWIRVNQLAPWPGLNPRRRFDATKHGELVASIKRSGVHEPILVHDRGPAAADFDPPWTAKGVRYWIVAGERRFRAARDVNVETLIPCMVRVYSEEEALEIALIENLDRDDLTPIEEARGFKRLLERPGTSQRKLAERVGRTQPYISNRIRLLSLPEDLLTLIEDGSLEMTHARDILLPYAQIPEQKRAQLYADVAKELRIALKRDKLHEHTVSQIVSHAATKLSRPVKQSMYSREEHEPEFDAKEHEKCTCQGPKIRYGYNTEVRCFDDDWWNAAQAAAIAKRQQAERKAAEKLAKKGNGDAPRVVTESTFHKQFRDHWQLPRLGRDVIDAKLLSAAACLIVKNGAGAEIYCVDASAYRKAKSVVTKEHNRILKEKKAARAEELRAKAEKAKLEPWMLAEFLAARFYDDAIADVARDIGISIEKKKGAGWDWFDNAVRKLSAADTELLFKALAIRSTNKELQVEWLSSEVDAQLRKRFTPGINALRKKLLEAGGVKASKGNGKTPGRNGADQDAGDLTDEELEQHMHDPAPADGEAQCVECGCTDSAACPEGCAWIVVDREKAVGVCSSCASTVEEARELLAGAVPA